VLYANQAWAYAMMGHAYSATMLLGRSETKLAKADLAEAPDWARFYNHTDLYAMIGTVHTELSVFDARHATIAIRALGHCLPPRGDRQLTEFLGRSGDAVRCHRRHSLAAQLLVADGPVVGEPGVDRDSFVRIWVGEGDKPAGVQGDEGLGDVVRHGVAALQPAIAQLHHAAAVDPPQPDPVVEISSG
jgi:hypothetical protein